MRLIFIVILLAFIYDEVHAFRKEMFPNTQTQLEKYLEENK